VSTGVIVTEELLLAGLGSNWSEEAMVAVLVCAFGEVTRAWIWSVCRSVVVTVPTVHRPPPAL